MADDPQRNFRSAYYEKVGFRGVEEKKSLEILLKDSPLGALTPAAATTRNLASFSYSLNVVISTSLFRLSDLKGP